MKSLAVVLGLLGWNLGLTALGQYEGGGGLQRIVIGPVSPPLTNAPIAIAESFTVLQNTTLTGQLDAWGRDLDALTFFTAEPLVPSSREWQSRA